MQGPWKTSWFIYYAQLWSNLEGSDQDLIKSGWNWQRNGNATLKTIDRDWIIAKTQSPSKLNLESRPISPLIRMRNKTNWKSNDEGNIIKQELSN